MQREQTLNASEYKKLNSTIEIGSMNSECWHVETIETKQMYYVAILLVLGNKSLCNSHLCYIKTYNKVFKTKETLNLDSVWVITEELCHKFDDSLK